jgi:hypothetical protein
MHTEEGNVYLGTVLFEKTDSAKVIFDLLYSLLYRQINTPLAT